MNRGDGGWNNFGFKCGFCKCVDYAKDQDRSMNQN